MSRYVCIHGHFYQPARENPWTGTIPPQPSAAPFDNWNARIAAECYGPNGRAAILDTRGEIGRVVNNYSRISFNFGPTLLAWLERYEPDTYSAILQGDRDSQKRFGGHGSAIAQAYGHMILPLSNPHDRRTQVRWGAEDFRRRFGRDPEGMWLPETAADVPTLEALADEEIRFTILSPYQAGRVRGPGERWQDVSGGRVDPTKAYYQLLPSGRRIAIFFYDGPASQGVAFEGLLHNGERLAQRLIDLLHEGTDHAQLIHIATDGESYGHHHKHGEMALAFALEQLEADPDVEITNYGQYLEFHPPVDQVEIISPSAWSCAHGVERWRSDCGCHTGGQADWNQAWRQPLRDTIDWLRDELALVYETEALQLVQDPWAARDEYISCLPYPTEESALRLLAAHTTTYADLARAEAMIGLLEMQRHSMLMQTSCGWFFNDAGGVETIQVLRHAGRALQLASQFGASQLEAEFLSRLDKVRSNHEATGTGRDIYEREIRSMMQQDSVGELFGWGRTAGSLG